MESFTLFDALAIAVILLSSILAYSRGFLRELMAIIGWVGAAVLAYIYAPTLEPFVKEVPVVGDFFRGSCELSILVAYIVIFVAGLLIAALFSPLLSSFYKIHFLGRLDQSLGFLFGAARGIFLIVMALIIYERALVPNSIPMITNSATVHILEGFQNNVDEHIPNNAPDWLISRYRNMTQKCTIDSQNSTKPIGS